MGMIIGLGFLFGLFIVLFVVVRSVARHVRKLPPASPAAADTRVLRHRFVRVIVGVTLLAGVLGVIGAAITEHPVIAPDLLRIWPAAAIAGVIASCVAPLVVRRVAGDAWATSSIVLPATGIALLLPLTLHILAFHWAGESWASVDDWCGLAVAGTFVAHIVFAVLLGVRAVSIARSGKSALSVGELFLLTTLASAFPFFVLSMADTAVTGLLILPAISFVSWIAAREHAALSSGLPRAIVSPCRA